MGNCRRNGDKSRLERCSLAEGNPCISCSEAIEIDALVVQARKSLADLLLKQQELHMGINVSHERIIHRLPPEVSALIFSFSLSEDGPDSVVDDKDTDSRKNGVVTTPLTLGAVCHSWQEIAWTSPQLWNHISIPTKPRSSFDYLDVAEEWLRRSGQLPLFVRIYTPCTASLEHDAKLLDRIASLIGDHLYRCCRLEISCPLDLVPFVSGDAPILEEIKLASDFDEYGSQLVSLNCTNPKGVRVSVTGFSFDCLSLTFENITAYEGSPTVHELFAIFALLPNLQDCQILRLWLDEINMGPLLADLMHKNLRKLDLQSVPDPTMALFYLLHVPSLTHLTLGNIGLGYLLAFAVRSRCNLHYLRIGSFGEGQALCEALSMMSMLEELHIIENGTWSANTYASDFFKTLAETAVVKDPSDAFLPYLSVFTLTSGELEWFSWELVARSFGSNDDIRNPLRRPLKTLRVIDDRSLNQLEEPTQRSYPYVVLSGDATGRFLEILQEGINVDIYDVLRKDDILLRSITHHNIAVPGSYKSKFKDSVLVSHMQNLDIASSDEESNSDGEDFNHDGR